MAHMICALLVRLNLLSGLIVKGLKTMSKAPKRACNGFLYCYPYYGNFDKSGNRIVSRYWCSKKSINCNDPKMCEFKKEKE